LNTKKQVNGLLSSWTRRNFNFNLSLSNGVVPFNLSFGQKEVSSSVSRSRVALQLHSSVVAADLSIGSSFTQQSQNALVFGHNVSDLSFLVFKSNVAWLVIINN